MDARLEAKEAFIDFSNMAAVKNIYIQGKTIFQL